MMPRPVAAAGSPKPPAAVVHRLRIRAHRYQFDLVDSASRDRFTPGWTADALRMMLSTADNGAAFATVTDGLIDLSIHVLARAPQLALTRLHHAAHGSFGIQGDEIVVLGSTFENNPEPRIAIARGHYRVLYVITSPDESRIGQIDGVEQYDLYLWPGEPQAARLIKRWEKPTAHG